MTDAQPRQRFTPQPGSHAIGYREQIAQAIAENGWADWAELVAAPVNGGFSYGNNVVVRASLHTPAAPAYYWLLNPDTRVQPGALRALPKGLHGRVVVVNKDWNFVVLDIGSRAGLVPNAEMLVHRGDLLIGKVLVSGVTRDLAIADIRPEWQQMQIQEGDFVAVQ